MTRKLPARLLRLLLLLAVLLAAVEVLVVFTILTNHKRGDQPAPNSLVAQALAAGGLERVEFYSADGTVLRGDLMGDLAADPVVVYGHGYRDRRRSGDHFARTLLASGYAVFLFDFRGSGASDGAFTGAGAIEGPDVAAALRYLESSRKVPPARTAYVGFSMGAAAGLLSRGALSRLSAVVLIAPYARLDETFEARTLRFAQSRLRPWFSPALWIFQQVLSVEVGTINPCEHAAEIAPAPLLLIGGADDWRAPRSDLERIFRNAREPKRLVLLEGTGHIDLLRMGPPVMEPVMKFLGERLLAGSASLDRHR